MRDYIYISKDNSHLNHDLNLHFSFSQSGSFDAVSVVHSYEHEKSVGHQKTKLSALNVPPMGLLYPRVLVPEEYPPPPRSWFQDYDDMLEDTWQTSDSLYSSGNGGFGMWDNYPMFPTRLKKFDNIGLVEAIVSSILSTGSVFTLPYYFAPLILKLF
jgi:actin-related protein 8